MRKILFIMLVFIAYFHVQAQTDFNTTFNGPSDEYFSSIGQKVAIFSNDNIDDETDDLIVFTSNNINPQGNCDNVSIVATDYNGLYQYSRIINKDLDKHQIVKTYDNYILFAGYSSVNNNDFWIMKLDLNFNLQWSRRVPIFPKNIVGPYENVDIEPVFDESTNKEYYFITFTEGNDETNYSDYPTQGIIKIDESGVMAWHNVYFCPGMNHQSHAITAYKNPGSDIINLSLAGTVRPGSFPNFSFPRLSFMSIDQNGIIVTPYRVWYTMTDYEINPDIVWDGNQFTVVWESASHAITYPAQSMVGIMKMDVNYDTTDYGTYWWYAIIDDWGQNNSGVSITLDPNNDFIISIKVERVAGNPPLIPWHHLCDNVHIFRLLNGQPLNNTFFPTTFKQTDSMIYTHQFHVTDNIGNTYLVPTKIDNGKYFPRLIKTNVNFDNCDTIMRYLYFYKPPMFGQPFDFIIKPFHEIFDERIQLIHAEHYQDFCGYFLYKPFNTSELNENNNIKIYPSKIKNNESLYICFDTLNKSDQNKIEIYDIIGHRIYNSQINENTISPVKLPSSILENGLNIINIYSNDRLLYSTKIIKQN